MRFSLHVKVFYGKNDQMPNSCFKRLNKKGYIANCINFTIFSFHIKNREIEVLRGDE